MACMLSFLHVQLNNYQKFERGISQFRILRKSPIFEAFERIQLRLPRIKIEEYSNNICLLNHIS